MWIAEVVTFVRWWDLVGFVIALFPPIVALFPLIFWIKEGTFPVLYFVVWGVGILGMVLASLGKDQD